MANDRIRVYNDQNALTFLAKSGDWRQTELGKALCESRVETWVSPVHLVEIVQTTDSETRQRLARTAIEVANDRRVLPGYQHILVAAFAAVLRRVDEKLIRPEYLDHHREGEGRSVVAALSLLAHGRTPSDRAVDDVLRAKFGSQKLHAEAVADPHQWISKLVECAEKLELTSSTDADVLDRATVDELREGVRESKPAGFISGKLRSVLQKKRRRIARAYGSVDIGDSLLRALPLPFDLDWTFNMGELRPRWNDVFDRIGAPSPSLQSGTSESLQAIILGLARGKGILPGTISNEVVIREVEHFAGKGKLPNAGVVFDGDHAVYLLSVNLFVSDDTDLRAIARSLLPLIEEETGGKWRPQVVSVAEAPEAILELLNG